MEERSPSKSFRDLIVWEKAHKLVLKTYKTTKQLPREELYGLASQIRRSSVSVAANIAEGFKKKGTADKLRFMNIAQGSLSETEYYLILIQDLEYGDTSELKNDADEVGKLLQAYMKAFAE
jgi:four helix bundle protein